MTPWLATGSHRCSTGMAKSPLVHAGTCRSSPGAGESKDGAGDSSPRVLQFPKGWDRARQGGFQLILKAYRAYKGGEPHLGTCLNETLRCRHLSS